MCPVPHRLSRAVLTAVLALACAVAGPLRGESSLVFRSLGVDEGLSQNFVTAIAQDREGFMWFGTLGGLSRWNGYEFTRLTHRPDDPLSLGDSAVLALHADPLGRVWVGTRSGLDFLEPTENKFRRFGHLLDGGRPVVIEGITSDPAGRVWCASFASGRLHRVEPRTGQVSTMLIPGLSRHWVTALKVDRQDRLWVATQQALNDPAPDEPKFRVFLFERCSTIGDGPMSAPREPFDLGTEGGKVVALAEDAAGRLWLARDGGGLLRFDPQAGALRRVDDHPANPDAMPDGVVRSFALDPTGRVWVLTRSPASDASTTPDRLYWVDPESLTARRVQISQRVIRPADDARMEHLAVDRSGVLWLGSNGGGLRFADASAGGFALYRQALAGLPGLDSSYVRAVCKTRDGMVWVGTPAGLNRLDRSKPEIVYRSTTTEDWLKLPHPNVQALCEDRRGDLWIGTAGGVAVLEQATGKVRHFRRDATRAGGLSDDFIQVIHEDPSGRLWFGTLGNGLDEFDPQTGRFTNYPGHPEQPDRLPSGTIYALLTDRQQQLWIGTAGGLAKLVPGASSERRIEHIAPEPQNLGGVTVLSLCENPATPDVLWLGTAQHGLCRLSLVDHSCRFWTTRNSALADDTIYGILADRGGRLWLSSNRGLMRFAPATEAIKTYGPEHGLQSSEFNGRAYFQSPDGELFFGGVGGLNSFHPEQVTDNPYPPKVLLTRVRVLDPAVKRSATALMTLHQLGTPTNRVALNYQQRDLTFDYVALHYSEPEKIRYEHKLDHYDAEWQGPLAERQARYTNLDPGDYTFRVRARSSSGVWSDEPASFSFVVLPPFYATAWFRVVAGLALVSALAGSYRWRTRWLHQRREELERQVIHRTEELRQAFAALETQAQKLRELDSAKSKFFANISHEFRTPLMLTLGPLKDVQSGMHGAIPHEALAEVEMALRNSNRLLELVDQLLLLARFDAGQAEFRPRALDLTDFLRRCATPYESLAKRQQIRFRLEWSDAPVPGAFDESKLAPVFGNLLGNAFKFTPAGGTVGLRLTTTPDGWAVIQVEDTGPGIPARDLPRIFERFYRGEQENGSLPGTGLGLALARECVELHGGEIRADNLPGGGARFTVRLPLRADLPKPPSQNSPDPDSRSATSNPETGRARSPLRAEARRAEDSPPGPEVSPASEGRAPLLPLAPRFSGVNWGSAFPATVSTVFGKLFKPLKRFRGSIHRRTPR